MRVRSSTTRPKTIDELLSADLMHRLDRLDVATRRIFAGRLPGERRSKRRGQSVEFEDYRQYVPGDDPRRLDWKIYARLDRLFLKIFLEEEDISVHLVLDASASMNAGDPDKLIFAQQLVMALGYVGLVSNNRVGVTVFGGEKLLRFPEARGRRASQRLGSFLLDVVQPAADESGVGASFEDAMKTVARTRVGSGVMIVISDFLFREGFEDGLRLLAGARGFDAWCLQTLSPGEIDPESERDEAFDTGITGDLALVDVETGHRAEVTVTAPLLKKYKMRVEQYCARLELYCASRSMTHQLIRTDADIPTLLLNQLRRRGLLK